MVTANGKPHFSLPYLCIFCPHTNSSLLSRSLAPEWNKAADNLRGLVKVAAIDCDAEANKGVCGYYEIKGFPTIKIFPPELKPDKKNPDMVTKRPVGAYFIFIPPPFPSPLPSIG